MARVALAKKIEDTRAAANRSHNYSEELNTEVEVLSAKVFECEEMTKATENLAESIRSFGGGCTCQMLPTADWDLSNSYWGIEATGDQEELEALQEIIDERAAKIGRLEPEKQSLTLALIEAEAGLVAAKAQLESTKEEFKGSVSVVGDVMPGGTISLLQVEMSARGTL